MTLDARVNERTRIARDLHDTLLQSFQSLLLSLQSVFHLLPVAAGRRESHCRQHYRRGRRGDHRGPRRGAGSARVGDGDERSCGGDSAHSAKSLRPSKTPAIRPFSLSRCRVGRDRCIRSCATRSSASRARRCATRSAHAAATQIDVELRYDERQFRLRVRDDGKGVDSTVLRDGRPRRALRHARHARARRS